MEGSSFNASPGPGTGSALLCSASLLVLSHQLGLVTPGRDPRQSASPPAYAEAQDPEVGTVPPLPSTDVFGRSLHGTGPIHQRVIVAAGSCSDCSAKTAEELIPKGRRLRETIVIYFDSLDKVKTHAAGIRNQALIVADPNLTLYRYLNAVWTPRYYLVDSRHRLVRFDTTFGGTQIPEWASKPVAPSAEHNGG